MGKRCNKCQLFLELKMFSKDKSRPDGLRTQCKACSKENHRIRNEKIAQGLPTIKSEIERFEEKFIKRPGCWNWIASTFKNEYGKFRDDKGNTTYAHRKSYEFYNGKIKKGMQICHSCDNRLCVNPEHLFQGSAKDNVEDMIKKGRNVTSNGSKSGMAKLDEGEVKNIRALRSVGYAASYIAKIYNVERNTIYYCTRQGWSHV